MIKTFRDLNTWKEAHSLVLLVYSLLKKFPAEERYALSDQLRRAVISISSNIAEGFSRQTKKEKQQFYFMSKGSLTEIENQLLVARDLHYISDDEFLKVESKIHSVGMLLTGLIRSTSSYL
ncbi:MAG TPA: four helix bundle protein [Patescibacteria group bacterium]|nr:four helix bundle protein [Patescibacteria group bacterium]